MSDITLLINLSKLGYTRKWLDSGVLTKENLHDQLELFKTGGDTNTEHYRYKTLIDFIESKSIISDVDLSNFLEIAISDADASMSSSAMERFLKKDYLTDKQFKMLSASLSDFGDWTEKVIARQKLIRRLKAEELTEELFRESLLSNDKVIHTILLSLVEHEKNRLEALAKNAANSKIKNQAAQLLKKLQLRLQG